MRRIRITLAYDGTAYHGWQVQPGLATIQGCLEEAVAGIEGRPVSVDSSGRTDAGVHAEAQVAAFHLDNRIPVENLLRALNQVLPRDIRVLDAREAAPDFHPRFQAAAKTYEYRIQRTPICPPFDRLYVYHFPYPLDEERFVRCARLFEGSHDFTCFAAADEKDALGASKVRTVWSSTVRREGSRLLFRVRGSGFLKHMVRNMTGVLVECGKGNLDEAAVRERLARPGAFLPGPAAPARGLFLLGVEYPTDPPSSPAPL
ncbi:MAG: tRNA pseudouridine(38-40) synthase TruA [Acidobacteria bacterium]|nr:tRNA pseudouridine(38-40) synthase TruA [Acidobacteriota bacterium]